MYVKCSVVVTVKVSSTTSPFPGRVIGSNGCGEVGVDGLRSIGWHPCLESVGKPLVPP
jgi:hypothetical protein